MHLVPALAVTFMKRQVLPRPSVNIVLRCDGWAFGVLLVFKGCFSTSPCAPFHPFFFFKTGYSFVRREMKVRNE